MATTKKFSLVKCGMLWSTARNFTQYEKYAKSNMQLKTLPACDTRLLNLFIKKISSTIFNFIPAVCETLRSLFALQYVQFFSTARQENGNESGEKKEKKRNNVLTRKNEKKKAFTVALLFCMNRNFRSDKFN